MAKLFVSISIILIATASHAQSEWMGMTRDSVLDVLTRLKARSIVSNGPLVTAERVRLHRRWQNVSLVINENGRVAQIFAVTRAPMPQKVFRERMLKVTEGETIDHKDDRDHLTFGRRKGMFDEATIFDKRTRRVTTVIAGRGANPVWQTPDKGIPGYTLPSMLHENEQRK